VFAVRKAETYLLVLSGYYATKRIKFTLYFFSIYQEDAMGSFFLHMCTYEVFWFGAWLNNLKTTNAFRTDIWGFVGVDTKSLSTVNNV
jgi:hypothetical protein